MPASFECVWVLGIREVIFEGFQSFFVSVEA